MSKAKPTSFLATLSLPVLSLALGGCAFMGDPADDQGGHRRLAQMQMFNQAMSGVLAQRTPYVAPQLSPSAGRSSPYPSQRARCRTREEVGPGADAIPLCR
jgi:hypothetical protein